MRSSQKRSHVVLCDDIYYYQFRLFNIAALSASYLRQAVSRKSYFVPHDRRATTRRTLWHLAYSEECVALSFVRGHLRRLFRSIRWKLFTLILLHALIGRGIH